MLELREKTVLFISCSCGINYCWFQVFLCFCKIKTNIWGNSSLTVVLHKHIKGGCITKWTISHLFGRVSHRMGKKGSYCPHSNYIHRSVYALLNIKLFAFFVRWLTLTLTLTPHIRASDCDFDAEFSILNFERQIK